jgi:hypothetical protein
MHAMCTDIIQTPFYPHSLFPDFLPLLITLHTEIDFFDEMGLTQDFTFAKQAVYLLSHTYNPFCSGYLGDGGVSQSVCLAWPQNKIFSSQSPKLLGLQL